MKGKLSALIVAGLIGLLIVAIGLGFLFGLSNPVSWILVAIVVLIPILYNRLSAGKQLVWKDEYSVGVQMLDDDHKKLIELVNKFHAAHQYHTGEEFEQQALTELVEYTKYHFGREEELMQQNGYPDFDAHKAQHEKMISEVEVFMKKYNEEGHEALGDVVQYLRDWLINHINGTDKQYTGFFNQQGIN
jgi:hemerythrin